MNPWNSQTEIVKAFIERGHPAYALAALALFKLALIAAFIAALAKLFG